MHSLPLVVSFALAVVAVGPALRELERLGFVRENYRGARVAFPGGIAVVAGALAALVPLAALAGLGHEDVFEAGAGTVLLYGLGVALLGLLDDLVGSGALVARPPGGAAGHGTGEAAAGPRPRGWRGHARATLGGGFSTGTLKAVGALGLALFVFAGEGLSAGEYVLAVILLVLATNLFNLLDLRPGRSLKVLLLLGAGLTIGSRDVDPLWAVGIFLGPLLALLPLDLRERAMLGDTGSNLAGAVAGLWLVFALSTAGQIVAACLIAAITVYGEFRSISELVERTPVLRSLDSLGRARHA